MALFERDTSPRAAEDTGAPEPTAAWASLRDLNYRLFWIGGLISNTGRWFQSVAVPAVIWSLTESPAWVGFTGFSRMAPMALVSPIAGALADRYDRRKLLLVTQSLQALATLLLMVSWIAGIRNPSVYTGLSALAGVFGGLNLPGWKAFVSDLVPRERLLNAITLNSMQFNASRMFGPALAGITIAATGPGWAFFINFVSFGAVLLALLFIRTSTRPAGQPEPFAPMRDFIETVHWIRSHAGIRQAIVTVGVIGLLGMPLQVLAIVFAEDVFDGGERAYGWMLTMMGIGAVATGPFIAGRGSAINRSRLQSAAFVVYIFGLTTFALAPNLIVAFAAMAFIGSAHLTSASVLNTTVQVQVPEARRAKVLSVHMMVVTLSSPVGQLVLGQVMSRITPRVTVIASSMLMALAAAMFIGFGRLQPLDDHAVQDDALAAPGRLD